ncbi:hypothetical protein IQ274_28675 [Nostoc sp. LEGE 12447]|uniref:glycosyl hydrolase family 18 protein n=1 Tax=Nostoc sp. LEGE 12447 TaxID=1828640 RepID=UPI0018838E1A|nr:glycosyl hydrolase family 18 protein [Nostoc sp. LEGE 12447]MBE9002069.1 hypothetical protein [Nostoc sp. LEGE 12447]
MGLSQDYPNVAEWVVKDTGYQAGEMVKYEGNIFKASYWAGAAPGQDPGWAIYDEMYDLTSTGNGQAKIIAYIPTWRKAEGFNYGNDEMYRYITHGIISFLQFSESNIGEFDQAALADVNAIIAEVVSAGHRNGTRISVAIGGAVDYGFLYFMERIGNNPSDPLLDQVVQNVITFVRANNLDGIDLDLECWWAKDGSDSGDQGGRQKSDGPHPAGRGLAEFARRLKEAMPNKIISAAVFATSWYGNNYDSALINYVDWVGIMSYDLTGSWNDSPVGPQTAAYKVRNQEDYMAEQQGEWPGPRQPGEGSDPISNNPIFSVEDSVWYWTNKFFVNWQGAGQNIPRNKIAGGVPIYGYDFAYPKEPDDLSGQVPPGYKSVRYRDILSQFPDAHTDAKANIKVPGSTPRPPFISASGNYPYAHNIYFETPGTAIEKLNLLKKIGAQGVIIWELSNDVWEEGKSIIKALYRNSGNPEPKPPILVEKPPQTIGGKRYNERSYLCTHNAFTNYEDARWTACNQSVSLTHQLERGVRALMLDTYYVEPGDGDVFKVIPEPGVYLLHEVNKRGWIAGISYAQPSRQLYQALNDVGKFLKEHREEVVTIFLEDYSYEKDPKLIESQILRADIEVKELIYNPNDHADNESGWKVKEKKQWPLLSDMIAWNKRLVIFGNRSENNSKFVAYDQDYIKENCWSLGDLAEKWDCPCRWNKGNYQDAKDYPKLFVFNHFRNAPTAITAAIDNTYDKIMDRINNRCFNEDPNKPDPKRPNQFPNFVAVDFFELPTFGNTNAGDVVRVLSEKMGNQG